MKNYLVSGSVIDEKNRSVNGSGIDEKITV